MAVDKRLNEMLEVSNMLDNLEQAVIDELELRGAPSGFVDEEEQRDIENAREEVRIRKELLRQRIIFRAIGPATRDKNTW